MSSSPKLQGLAALGLALLSLSACTLTSDSFEPGEALRPLLPALDAGRDPSDSGDPPASEPPDDNEVPCSAGSERTDCDIGIATPGSTCVSDLDCSSLACVSRVCASPTCSDGRHNGDELGVDCGGDCALECGANGCTTDAECESNNCSVGSCQPATCSDGRSNQAEAGVDCAGPCPARCSAGDTCAEDEDCAAGLFCPEATRRCTSVSCQDDALNGAELATDCGGGTCPGCPVGTTCTQGIDCLTGVCGGGGTCAAPTCGDGVRNQNETDTDCGGSCSDCVTGDTCVAPTDCQSGVCNGAGCPANVARCCQPPRCNDGIQNGTEPVADCGNAACGACPLNSPCTANAQCTTGSCQAGLCRPPPCNDNVRNGTETDTDCGGADPTGARCGVGDICANNADCASGACTNGACSACNDGQRNGTESDTDCGGVCGDCDPGEDCNNDADCSSGACQDGRCCGGDQVDCTRCARRLVAGTITCSTNGPAAEATCQAFMDCLTANPAACPVRHAPGCSDDVGVCNHNNFGGNGGPGVGLADAILGTATCDF